MNRLRAIQMIVAVMVTMISITASADTEDNHRLMAIVTKALPGTDIDTVSPSPVNGLIEVVAGGNVLYLEENGRYLVVGSLYDLVERIDITADRRETIRAALRIDWESIPDNTAGVIRRDKLEEETLAVLFDPLCGYCRKLYHALETMRDVSVRFVMLAEQPGSLSIVQNVMCSKEPQQALITFYQQQLLAEASEECKRRVNDALRKNKDFSKANNLSGTPVLISRDGRIKMGALESMALQKWVDESTSNFKPVNAANLRGR